MSTDELNIIKYKREMEQMIVKNILNLKRLNEILSHLHSVNVDLSCLQRTKIGVCINNVRKTFKNNAQIFQSTAELIKKWKKIAKEQFDHRKNSSSVENDQEEEDHFNESGVGQKKNEDEEIGQSKNNDDSASNSESASETSSSILGSRNNDSSDHSHDKGKKRKSANKADSQDSSHVKRVKKSPSVDSPSDIRHKSVQLLFEAIKFEKVDHQARAIAEKIEETIFADSNQDVNNKNYKAKIRSRVMNLRDKNNPDLLKNVIIGRITAEKFARMSVEEMASEHMKNLRKSIEEESIQERQSKDPSSVGLAKSDAFPCPECNERDACYRLCEDRMDGEYDLVSVTSLFCNKCGHSWKCY